MYRYILRRLSVIPFALILVHFLGFAYAHLVRPLRAARNPYLASMTDSTPLLPTYLEYIQKASWYEFGTLPGAGRVSGTETSLIEGILNASVASLGLLGIALLISILIGLALGIFATRTNPPSVARWMSSFSTIGLAMPSFYLGSLFFAGWFLYVIWAGPDTEALLPFQGFGWDSHLIMPALVLIARPTVQIAQITSTLLAEELGKQYIVAARSIGHTWRTIRRHHAMRNIIAPVILTIAGSIRLLVAELIVVEWLFNWPGLGSLLAYTLIPSGSATTSSSPESILFLNPPVVSAVITVFAALFLGSDLIASALVRVFDPRFKTEK